MKKLMTQLWDKMHYMFRKYNDRMVHVSLTYDFLIDTETFGKALTKLIDENPVLHSSFVYNPVNPYWLENEYSKSEVFSVLNNPINLDAAVEAFLLQEIKPENNVQMKVKIFNFKGQSTVCLIVNHMCMDGGALKEFLSELMSTYDKFLNGENVEIKEEKSRSHREIYSQMDEEMAKEAKRLFKNPSPKDKHGLPFAEPKDSDKSFIVKRKISSDTFLEMKSAGKKIGATVNDVLVAAFLQTVYEIGNYDANDSITVSCAMDLRKRYLSDMESIGHTNHTAFMGCTLDGKSHDMVGALERVRDINMENKSDSFQGLYGLPLLDLAYGIMPYALAEEVIKLGYSNPLLAMSNIGVLDTKALSLEGNAPVDGFMTGAVKFKPFSLMSATTMNNEMTLAFCERGSEEDKEMLENFFDILEENISELVLKLNTKIA